MAEKGISQKSKKTIKELGKPSKIKSFLDYLHNARFELRKVSWPTRRETLMTGLAVFVVVFVISLFLGIVDFAISALIRYLLSL